MTQLERVRDAVSMLIVPESECKDAPLTEIGKQYAYREVLDIIDSTQEGLSHSEVTKKSDQEAVCDDLEKEIIRYQKEDHDRDTTVRDVARHFANWQKEQMMKNSVEGIVAEPACMFWRIVSEDLTGEFVVKNDLHDGDMVKMIIVKDD